MLGEVHAQRLDVLADAQHAGHLHPHEHPAGEHLARGMVRCTCAPSSPVAHHTDYMHLMGCVRNIKDPTDYIVRVEASCV